MQLHDGFIDENIKLIFHVLPDKVESVMSNGGPAVLFFIHWIEKMCLMLVDKVVKA
jgi:hypothetical protein